MIKGDWGAGKTFLIKSFIAKLKDTGHITPIYISLYGKAASSQIDDDIFQKLHPILGSKGVKILGLVAKGLIKSATKIDLGKIETVTFNAELPSVNISEMFPSPTECLIVFDDLERCSIPLIDVLGYINSFVEHESVKVIVIANEKDIESRGEFERYKITKEKIIGKTLEVRSIETLAIHKFVNSVRDERTKEFMKTEVDQIIDIHKRSESNNLRILQQGIWDFERLSSCFSERHWESAAAMRWALVVILALSYEFKKGRLSEEDLHSVIVNNVARMTPLDNKAAPATNADQVRDRYPNVDFDQVVLSPTTVANLLLRGWIDRANVASEVDASSFFADPAQEPAWRTVLQVWQLPDERIAEASRVLETQFLNREYDVPGGMFQVFGARLFLSEVGLIAKSKKHVQDECIEYIDNLHYTKRIRNKYLEETSVGAFGGWSGYTFACGETNEFKEIVAHYKIVVEKVAEELLPSVSENLLKLLSKDPNEFAKNISHNSHDSGLYLDVPVLKHIQPMDFAEAILCLKPEHIGQVFVALSIRYDGVQSNAGLISELPWIEQVLSVLEKKLETLSPISRFRVQNCCNRYLRPRIQIVSGRT